MKAIFNVPKPIEIMPGENYTGIYDGENIIFQFHQFGKHAVIISVTAAHVIHSFTDTTEALHCTGVYSRRECQNWVDKNISTVRKVTEISVTAQ